MIRSKVQVQVNSPGRTQQGNAIFQFSAAQKFINAHHTILTVNQRTEKLRMKIKFII